MQLFKHRLLQTARSCQKTTEKLSKRNVELQSKIVELKAEVEDECVKNVQLLENLEIGKKIKYNVAQKIKKINRYQIKLEKILKNHGDILKTKREIEENVEVFQQLCGEMMRNLPRRNDDFGVDQQHGFTTARIQQFQQFPADESFVCDRCGVCLDDIEVGRFVSIVMVSMYFVRAVLKVGLRTTTHVLTVLHFCMKILHTNIL